MEPWLTQSLVGTGKQPALAEPNDHPALSLVEQLGEPSVERRLLLEAGIAAMYATAGHAASPAGKLPEEAPAESRPFCPPRAVAILRDLFGQSTTEEAILIESLDLVRSQGQVVPPQLVPVALMIPNRTQLRAAVRGVLGERGRWLAQFDGDWIWARHHVETAGTAEQLPADAELTWQEGALPVRLELLALARRIDPAKARAWVAAVWKVEKADARQKMLEAFSTNLSADDLPLLKQALADRSSGVRSRAAQWLARIPDSPLAVRMRERAKGLLTFTPAPQGSGIASKLKSLVGGKRSAGKLAVVLPAEFPKDWAQDGLEAKPPQGVGERTFWFSQVVALIPPEHWTRMFTAQPAELIAATVGHDHEAALIGAWESAALLHESHAWLATLWDHAFSRLPEAKSSAASSWGQLLQRTLAALPAAEAESRLVRSLTEHATSDDLLAAGFAHAVSAPWSDALASAAISWYRRMAAQEAGAKIVYVQQAFLHQAAVAIPANRLAAALLVEPTWSAEASYQHMARPVVADFQRKVRLRQELHAAMSSG